MYYVPLVKVHKSAETIQGRKLFKGGNYSWKYGMFFEQFCDMLQKAPSILSEVFVAWLGAPSFLTLTSLLTF